MRVSGTGLACKGERGVTGCGGVSAQGWGSRFRSTGGGSPKGWVHNLLMQFFTLGSSKIEVFETCFFDMVIT